MVLLLQALNVGAVERKKDTKLWRFSEQLLSFPV